MKNIPAKCHECGDFGQLVTGKEIYPHRPDLFCLKFWKCNCGAYVGCHEAGNGYGDGTRPLGTMAGPNLRKARRKAHWAFDHIWRDGMMKRKAAYRRLSEILEIDIDDCHISQFDELKCFEVELAAEQIQNELGGLL